MKLYQQSLELDERLGDLKGKAATLHQMANVLVTRGDLDGAMRLYQQSLELDERLGDLQGKAATLHEMANVLVTRGDLDGAMRLYQQSLELDERLGDLKGKAATLAMMAQVHILRGEQEPALRALLVSLQTLSQIGATPDAQKVAGILADWREQMGAEAFDRLWQRVTGEALTPGPSPFGRGESAEGGEGQAQAMTVEQFIALVLTAAREKRPEAAELFEFVSRLAADPSQPAALRRLGKVLQRLMLGDSRVDLSGLPAAWVEVIRKYGTVNE
jgi:tetratricopeptide (TPR) repeat protein